MFNVGGPEFLVILLVALVVLGPTRLPDALRQLGKFIGEAKKISTNFQNEVQQAMKDPVQKVTGVETPKIPRNAKEIVGFAVNEPFKAQENTPHPSDEKASENPTAAVSDSSNEADASDKADADAATNEPKGPTFNSADPAIRSAEPATPVAPVGGEPVAPSIEPVAPNVEPATIASPAAIEAAFEDSNTGSDDGEDDVEVPMFGDR